MPPEQAAASKAAAKIAEAESPEAKRADEIGEAVAKIKEDAKDLPSANDLPESGVAPKEVEEVGPGAGDGHDHDHADHDHAAELRPRRRGRPSPPRRPPRPSPPRLRPP